MKVVSMDVLTSLTSELKEALIGVNDYSSKEEIIFENIKTAEKLKYVVDDFPPDLDWFNTSEPLSGLLLQGKIVVLDFFTYCCINCLHIIPCLRQLEENFSVADGLVVIGVHSAKFDNEKDSENILLALKRYNISHPVVNDKNCYLWDKLNISCWPTIVILGPQRQPIFALVGEGHRDELFLFVKVALKYFKKSISSHQLPLINCDQIVTSSLLSFPGKISSWKNLLALSDSGNHRVLIFDKDGVILYKIGGKTPGFKDGSFETAQFSSPQGLAFYDSNTIYIADTENHAIRLINLLTLKVTTVVGNGYQGIDCEGGKIGTLQEISSPWDVCVVPCSDVEVLNAKPSVPVELGRAAPIDESVPPPFPFSATSPPPPPPPPPPFSVSSSNSSPSRPPFSDASFPSVPLPPAPPELAVSNLRTPPPTPVQSSFSKSKNISSSKILLIAAAGTHQIWAYFIEANLWWKGKKYEKNVCVAVAGSGREENRNNCYPMMASFAQPSGLTYCPELKSVFIADSESSSIRRLSTKDGSVSHVVGATRSPHDLFSYGDVDGKAYNAKLQHPLGVAWNSKEKFLYICDTYNHKIKKIDVDDNTCTSIHNNNWFSEPSGCCFDETGNILYVTDTNNNKIKIVDLKDSSVRKFDLKEKSETIGDTPLKDIWEAETHISKNGGALILKIYFSPKEVHGKWRMNIDESKIKVESLKGKVTTNVVELEFLVGPSNLDDLLEVYFDLVLCGGETCTFKKNVLKLFIRRKDDGETAVVCKLSKNLM